MHNSIFISYSRDDAQFATQLAERLKAKYDPWIDFEDLKGRGAEPWWQVICDGINQVEAFIFIISPRSIASPICNMELEYARSRGKRIIPLYYEETGEAAAFGNLAARKLNRFELELLAGREILVMARDNWFDLARYQRIDFQDEKVFDTQFEILIATIEKDSVHRNEHTRLLVRAVEWDNNKRGSSFLLRGDDLLNAEQWLLGSGTKEPPPQELHRQFIFASRQATNARRRLAQMGIAAGIAGSVLLITAIVFAIAFERNATEADQQRRRAEQAELTTRSLLIAANALQSLANSDLELAVLLGLEAMDQEKYPYTPQAEQALAEIIQHPLVEFTLKAPVDEGLSSTVWSKDGHRILTAGGDGTVRVWDVETKTEIEALRIVVHPDLSVNCAEWSPDETRILTAGVDSTASIWDVEDVSEALRSFSHEEAITCASWSPDGTHIATASVDGTAKIWDANNDSEPQVLDHGESVVYCVEWSPDGERILTASSDNTAKVWDVESGELLLTLSGHSDEVACAIWSPDGRQIATAGKDDTVKIWDAQSGNLIDNLPGHRRDVRNLAWSPNGRYLATASQDNTARIWDIQSGELLFTLSNRIGKVRSGRLAWSPDGDFLSTAGDGSTVQVWSMTLGIELTHLDGHEGQIFCAEWSPDSTRIITASEDQTAIIWDVDTGEKLHTFEGHKGAVRCANWSPDSARVITVSEDATAKIWDALTFEELYPLEEHDEALRCAAWSPDGTQLLTSSVDGTVKVWDANDFASEPVTLHDEQAPEGEAILCAFWSSDGSLIVTTTDMEKIKIWDVASRQIILTLEDHTQDVYGGAWLPDSQRFLTYGRDNTAIIWQLAEDHRSAQVLFTIPSITGHVISAGWLLDTNVPPRIITAGSDDRVRIWDGDSGQLLMTLPGKTDQLVAARWAPDSQHILTTSRDGTAKIWRAWSTTQDLIDFAQTCCIMRDLTEEERVQFGLSIP